MKLLVIEDEIEILSSIKEFLEKEKFLVETASTFESALDKALNYSYDCIILDIMLPGGSGFDLLKELRANRQEYAVLILSAKDSVDDKVKGLELGADDYLAKPFHFSELLARIKSIIRRRFQDGIQVLKYKSAVLNPDAREIYINDEIIHLNRKEFDILYYFMLRPNRLLERTTLAETVWGDHADQADNLDFIYSQIKNLRKKLKDANADFDIQSVYGIGYKLV